MNAPMSAPKPNATQSSMTPQSSAPRPGARAPVDPLRHGFYLSSPALVVKLVDTLSSGGSAARHPGSNPGQGILPIPRLRRPALASAGRAIWEGGWRGSSGRVRGLHLYPDAAPLSLAEPQDAQSTAGHVTEENRRPDVGGT